MKKIIILCGTALCVSAILQAVIFNQYRKEVLHFPRFHKYRPLFFRKFFTCFYGVIKSIPENGTNIQRLNKIYTITIICPYCSYKGMFQKCTSYSFFK